MSSFGQCAGPAPEQRAWGGGSTGKVFSQFGSEDRKKVLHPKLRLVDTGSLPPFLAQFSFGEARSLLGVAPRNVVVRISALAHKFKSKDQKLKKIFGAKSLASSWRTLVFFVRERDFTHAWKGTSSILRGHRPRNALPWHRAGYFLLGHNSRLGGTSSDFGGSTAPKCPPVAPGLAMY